MMPFIFVKIHVLNRIDIQQIQDLEDMLVSPLDLDHKLKSLSLNQVEANIFEFYLLLLVQFQIHNRLLVDLSEK